MRGYEFPYDWKVSYNENADTRYGYGMDSDWLYAQLGIWAVTTELWNAVKDIPGLVIPQGGDQRTNQQLALLKYQDAKYNGALFVNWKNSNTRSSAMAKSEVGRQFMLPIMRSPVNPF
ncbi:MAG: hypothetical protein MZV63_14615 [Marinilabiliales bacterium]|nr:hypothetical protein [Marinilabiliales bacterium]